MPWHRLGTVSVTQNSSTVTGVNTAFAANSRIGDAFIGPDGRQYELGNVASDTVISIIPPYLGPTVAGAAYAVTPVQGYQKGLADQVRDWVNTYGPKMAVLGTTGNYDILPVIKGGTGATTAASARSALGLGTAATALVVGTPTDPTAGRVLTVGYGGTGARDNAVFEGTFKGPDFYVTGGTVTGQFVILGTGKTGTLTTYAGSDATVCSQSFLDWADGQMYTRVRSNSAWQAFRKLYSDGNTTRAADGTLKAI